MLLLYLFFRICWSLLGAIACVAKSCQKPDLRICDSWIWEVGLGPTPDIGVFVKRLKSRVGLGPTLDFIRLTDVEIWGVGPRPTSQIDVSLIRGIWPVTFFCDTCDPAQEGPSPAEKKVE